MNRMNRKQFLSLAAVGIATAALPGLSLHAQEKFRTLKATAPTDAEAGKIEVVEFFWFGCPHC
jgi:thiol:disulfide interchange protein DsbA